jgi:hypothetical protein
MTNTMRDTNGLPHMTLPNPSRAEVQARLAQQPTRPAVDLGVYDMNIRYDRDKVLSRLPGNDLQSIAASATADAAACSKSGTLHFVWALPTWIAGIVCLFFLGAPVAGIVALGVGTLGIVGGVQKMARSNLDKILMNDIQALFADPATQHRS